jgi:hypothetical protein
MHGDMNVKPLITVGTLWGGTYIYFFFCGATTLLGPDSLNVFAVYRSHTRQHSAEQVNDSSQSPLNTRQAQNIKIHAHSGIPTRDLNNQAAADFRFRPHGNPESARNMSLEIIFLSNVRWISLHIFAPPAYPFSLI